MTIIINMIQAELGYKRTRRLKNQNDFYSQSPNDEFIHFTFNSEEFLSYRLARLAFGNNTTNLKYGKKVYIDVKRKNKIKKTNKQLL